MKDHDVSASYRHAARQAGLRYVSDDQPGFARQRRRKGFRYLHPDGRLLRDRSHLHRIASLVIPPAWKRVWICRDPRGHLQATGFDARDRKQYRYHPQWSAKANENKFSVMAEFGESLPAIRRRVANDLRGRRPSAGPSGSAGRPGGSRGRARGGTGRIGGAAGRGRGGAGRGRRGRGGGGLERDRVLACIVKLLDEALIRVGNDEYARQNGSFGLTTIRNHHARVRGDRVRFCFKGKSGRQCEAEISDPRISRIVRRCQDLPGQELFGYVDERGGEHDVGSADVNDYLFRISGRHFTAKDFRTWGGTVVAAQALHRDAHWTASRNGKSPSKGTLERSAKAAVRCAAEALGNTPATCRKFYVHPRLTEFATARLLQDAFVRAQRGRRLSRMTTAERAVLHLVRRLKNGSANAKTSTD